MPHEHLDRMHVYFRTMEEKPGSSEEDFMRALALHNREEGHRSHEWGQYAVSRVASIIADIPGVIAVRQTESQSEEDKEGKDLVVTLTPDQPQEFEEVSVEVKASKDRIKKMRRGIKKRLKEDNKPYSDQDVTNFLIRERYIVLVGGWQKEDDKIRESFRGQLKTIRAYYRNTLLD